jgi:ankyrin repeat protein
MAGQRRTRLSPVFNGSRQENLAALQLLLDRGAMKDSKDADGHTALDLAIGVGHFETVKILERAY